MAPQGHPTSPFVVAESPRDSASSSTEPSATREIAGSNTSVANATGTTLNTSARSSSQETPGVITPLRSSRLEVALQGYDPQLVQELLEGFRHGFRIHSDINSDPGTGGYANHLSAIENEQFLQEKLDKEMALGRISGPFQQIPFQDMVISPLGLVPKKDLNQFRVIHDLSFPHNDSVNSHIDREYTAVTYETLDTCIAIIVEIGEGCLIAKADLQDAFRLVPIHPLDRRLLGFVWKGLYYYDNCLPMGCSISCQTFEKLSAALQWILQVKFEVPYMSHILDDFIFFGHSSQTTCRNSLVAFLSLAESLNLPVKHSKTVQPSTCVQLHGIEVDTIMMQLRLPQDKLDEVSRLVDEMHNKKKVSLKSLQSLIGKLGFACRVIIPGRAFLRRLHDLTKGVTRPYRMVRLNNEARADLAAWKLFLQSFNGVAMLLPNRWLSSNIIKLYSDASGKGFAAVFGSHWLQGQFPPCWESVHITVKELLPIVLAMRLWGAQLRDSRILFFSHNLAVVHIINSQSSKDTHLMSLVRTLVLQLVTYNIDMHAKHIPGRDNNVCDLLSRFQNQAARQLAPWLRDGQDSIPPHWLPWYNEQAP